MNFNDLIDEASGNHRARNSMNWYDDLIIKSTFESYIGDDGNKHTICDLGNVVYLIPYYHIDESGFFYDSRSPYYNITHTFMMNMNLINLKDCKQVANTDEEMCFHLQCPIEIDGDVDLEFLTMQLKCRQNLVDLYRIIPDEDVFHSDKRELFFDDCDWRREFVTNCVLGHKFKMIKVLKEFKCLIDTQPPIEEECNEEGIPYLFPETAMRHALTNAGVLRTGGSVYLRTKSRF